MNKKSKNLLKNKVPQRVFMACLKDWTFSKRIHKELGFKGIKRSSQTTQMLQKLVEEGYVTKKNLEINDRKGTYYIANFKPLIDLYGNDEKEKAILKDILDKEAIQEILKICKTFEELKLIFTKNVIGVIYWYITIISQNPTGYKRIKLITDQGFKELWGLFWNLAEEYKDHKDFFGRLCSNNPLLNPELIVNQFSNIKILNLNKKGLKVEYNLK